MGEGVSVWHALGAYVERIQWAKRITCGEMAAPTGEGVHGWTGEAGARPEAEPPTVRWS